MIKDQMKAGRAFTAGFVATLVMTLIMYVAPMMGMPKMDVAAMLGNFITGLPAEPFNAAWNLGMLIHFIDGTIIFSLIYVFTLYRMMPGRVVQSGTLFGIALWFLSQIIVMPIMGAGLFAANTPRPVMTVIGSLIGHIIYGAILGKLIGEPITESAEQQSRVRESEVEVHEVEEGSR